MQALPPTASIVIVNCNYADFIGDAIDGALAQTHQPTEVIVVDDGSTDHSRAVIDRYGDRIQKVFQPNGGQGAAYNAGWAAATGKYILFLDSDDVLQPGAMAKIVEAFERSGAVKVQFYLEQVDRNMVSLGTILPTYTFSSMEPRRQIENYGYYVSPPASGNAFRASFLQRVMPIRDTELYRRAADGYTTGLAPLAGHIESIAEVLGYYRVHGANYGGFSGVRNVEHLHHMFMRDVKRENTQHAFAEEFNFYFPTDRSRYCPGHTKFRLLSQRLYPQQHPLKTDSTGQLMWCGFVSAWRYPHLKWYRRAWIAMGFLMLGITPRSILRARFDSVVMPQQLNRTT